MRPVVAAVLILAAGCRSNSLPDSGTDSDSDSDSGSGWGALCPGWTIDGQNAYAFDVGFLETPRFEDDYNTGAISRSLSDVRVDAGIYEHLGDWSSEINANTEKSVLELGWTFTKPLKFSDAFGRAAGWRHREEGGGCGGDETSGVGVLEEDLVVDRDGGVIFWSSLSSSLEQDGGVGAGLAGLPISWVECSGEKSGLRQVALQVGTSPAVPPGTQGDVVWAGVTYRLRVAVAYVKASQCGGAVFFLGLTDAVP